MPPEMRRISPVTQEELGIAEAGHAEGDVLGLAPAAQRDGLADPLDHLLLADPQCLGALCHHLPVEVRVHGTGTDGVDAYAVGGELQRQRAGQTYHARLCHVVGGDRRGRILAVDRRQVDDATGLLPFHDPRRRAATLERAVQVHLQHLLPLLVAEFDDRGHVLAQPGAVHEDVQPPACLGDLCEQCVHLGGRRHVQAGGCRGPSLAGKRGGNRLGLLALQIRDDHGGASGCQGFGDGPSESLRRPRDHRHLA